MIYLSGVSDASAQNVQKHTVISPSRGPNAILPGPQSAAAMPQTPLLEAALGEGFHKMTLVPGKTFRIGAWY